MRSQIHELELVYPPVSNQEAEWIKNDSEVLSTISHSNLYFIGQKPETFFFFDDDVAEKIEAEKKIYFGYKSGKKTSRGYIDLLILIEDSNDVDPVNLDIELGPKLIRIWNLNNDEVLDWFTTDKILYDKSRKFPYIIGFLDYREFYSYNLHYVGISKKDNSFKRLVVKPHDKRLRVLSNEHPLNISSRLTDEIVLFFFKINSLEIKMYLEDKDFEELGKTELDDKIRIVSDAEKAFVKIMDSKYNEVKFNNYPISTDGLYLSSVERHSYSIDEDLTFITDNNTIRGARKDFHGSNQGDFIAISKSAVDLIKVDSN